ncbi:MAG: hypothetical protein GXP10_00365, partial [Gammaproteobacteria bacterium]|nr:hypothetical protein [Gammaproteobacteria bacterium]
MPDTPANIVELGFGQTEPLTVRLHGLIRNYPKGVGIIKEFIQNSDDAGARRVEIIMDWRSHDAEQLPAPEMKELNGPALLVFNDQTFTDDDFRSIQEIGQSGKSRTIAKTGRFGFGFNASYNITDYPGFISGDSIAFFDPHQNLIPQAKQGSGLGGRWKLTETFWQQYPDLLSPFFAGGLKQDETQFNGTIFRLPLRTESQASNSQICSEPFTEDDFQRILQQLSEFGSELLLFLKHVLFIQVSEISSDGKKRVVLDLSTNNCDEVVRHRTQLNSAAASEYDLLHNLRGSNSDNAPQVSYRHAITVNSDKGQEYHLWRIVNGFYNDEQDRVLDAAADMLVHDEKAVPWVGAAARLEHDMETHRLVPTPVEGRLYCSLPLQEQTRLPVHINGFFDLDSSRQSLTADRSLVGKDACRVQWNELLIEHSLSRAYVHLLEELTADCSAKEVDAYYKLWPNADQPPSGLLEKLPSCVYQQASTKQIIHSCREQQPWTTISAVSLAPESWEAIQEPLIADNMLLPRPALPASIIHGYEKAAVNVNWLTPAAVREQLRVDEDINLPLAEITRPCLTNREWLVLLLRFCISDNPGREIEGLPLALLADGKLH